MSEAGQGPVAQVSIIPAHILQEEICSLLLRFRRTLLNNTDKITSHIRFFWVASVMSGLTPFTFPAVGETTDKTFFGFEKQQHSLTDTL